MMTADEAKKITKEAIQKQKEEERRILEIFLAEAEKEIKENAKKSQSTCYMNIPEAFKYNEYKIIDALREYKYGAYISDFETIRISW